MNAQALLTTDAAPARERVGYCGAAALRELLRECAAAARSAS